jgi:hypothetical protein
MIEERYALDFQLEFYYRIIDSYHHQQRNRVTKILTHLTCGNKKGNNNDR